MTSLKVIIFAIVLFACTTANCGAYFTKHEPVIRHQSTSIYHVESRLHLDRNRWNSAVASLTKSLHENPNDLRVAIKLADLHYRARRYAKSIEILRDYVDRATAEQNVFYYLALSFDRVDNYRNALGYYYKALQLDPRLLKAYVRIARIRVRQGLVYDGAKALTKCLSIDPDYFPALQEQRVVNRLIKMNAENIYRRGNVVILFPDHRLYRHVEEMYPRVQKSINYLERNLKYHIPELWIKVVKRVERHEHPPALYDHIDSAIYVEIDAIKKGELRPLLHELTYMYVRHLTKNHCPDWLEEGLCLWVSRPLILRDTPLRTLKHKELDFKQNFPRDKRFLRWETTTPRMRRKLLVSYLIVKYLLDNYGWPSLRKILAAFADDTSRWDRVVWNVLHLDEQTFQRRWDVFTMSNYYFSPATIPSSPK